MADFESLISEALTAKEDSVTQAFRTYAVSKGWPLDMALKISTSLSLDGITYVIPEELQDQADLLEYGDGKTPPKAVLRTFEDTIIKKLEQDLTNAIVPPFIAEIERGFAEL